MVVALFIVDRLPLSVLRTLLPQSLVVVASRHDDRDSRLRVATASCLLTTSQLL